MPPKKKVIKEKKQKKVKQKQSQSQSQKVIINLNEVKTKPKRKANNNKNILSDMSAGFIKYSPQDYREINTLNAKLTDVENKLLNIKNVKNPVNNNSNPPIHNLYSRNDNIGDWHNSKQFKDYKKQEEQKQNKTNLNKDIINQSKIFNLNKQLKDEKKETRKHVNLFMQSEFENDRLRDNIVKDRDIYNNYLNDIEIEKENEKKEQAFMRENDKNVKKLGRPTKAEQRKRYDMRNSTNEDDENTDFSILTEKAFI